MHYQSSKICKLQLTLVHSIQKYDVLESQQTSKLQNRRFSFDVARYIIMHKSFLLSSLNIIHRGCTFHLSYPYWTITSLLLELSSSHSFGRTKTQSPTRPLLILTNRNKSWTHVIICDYLIGVQWLIRLPALRAGVQWLLAVLEPGSHASQAGA